LLVQLTLAEAAAVLVMTMLVVLALLLEEVLEL
jgi:hypothetical protein